MEQQENRTTSKRTTTSSCRQQYETSTGLPNKSKKYKTNQNTPPYIRKKAQKHATRAKHQQDGRIGYNNTSQKPEKENKDTQIEHISDQTWGEIENETKTNTTTPIQQISTNLQKITEQTQLINVQQKHPQVTNMLLKEYTQKRYTTSNKTTKKQQSAWNGRNTS